MNETIFAQQLAEVVRRLRERGINEFDKQLESKIENAFAMVLGGSVEQRASQLNIDLPDLEEGVQAEIVKDNVMALSALYFAAQLEDLKFFAVADRIADHFQTGIIPVSRSLGGEMLYRYIRNAPNRFTEAERRGIFARAFGFAQGAVDEPMPNREFGDLWIRFFSAVSVLSREWGATIRKSVVTQTALKNGRDLAVNLSLHGYGIAHFAAVELQDHIKNLLKMMGHPDILQAYGVQDVWQLNERVSALYLGGATNTVRQRTLASSGSKVIQWLARNERLLANYYGSSVDLVANHAELVQNVEAWLAVTGTDDQSVERYSDPVSLQAQPTIPDMSLRSMPDAINDLVGQAGLSNLMNPGQVAKA